MNNAQLLQRDLRSINWRYLVTLALVLMAALVPSLGFAQAMGDMPTLTEIQNNAGTVETDTSRMILKRLFGDFGVKPFAAVGTADTLLGILFFTFNAVIFVVGTSYIGYQIVMAIASSAHEGEVLGKRMNSLWAPIRLGVGIFGMLPVFMGFSLAQSVILGVALLGIGMANMMVDKTVAAAYEFKSLVPPPGLVNVTNANGSITEDIAHNLFLMNVCVRASADYNNQYDHIPVLGSVLNAAVAAEIKITSSGVTTWSPMTFCGHVKIIDQTDKMRINKEWYEHLGMEGFRTPAVDYKAINDLAKASMKERHTTLKDTHEKVQILADKWYEDTKAGRTSEYPLETIRTYVAEGLQKENENLQKYLKDNQQRGAFTDGIAERMKEGGWLSIGSWYSAFAEQDAAIQSAFVSNYMEMTPPNFSSSPLPPTIQDPLLKVLFARDQAKKTNPGDDCKWWGQSRSAAGECNWGQGAAMALIGSLSDGGEGMVNPIITAKNIGDYMLNTVGAVAGYSLADKNGIVPDSLSLNKRGMAAADKVAEAERSITDMVAGFGGKIMSALFMACLVLGIVFAVYIPLIPFITWFTATVSYFASVIEGLVGAQIWAFTHLSSEGEGMGQKTEKGYIYMLNMLLRPALMVLGFFFASALMTLMATFLFQQLGTALANLQGDTSTGPMIILGMLFVYMIILITMIQTLCNLIYEIPDRVIAWFGQSMEAKLAKQMDSSSEAKFESSTRWAGQAAAIHSGKM